MGALGSKGFGIVWFGLQDYTDSEVRSRRVAVVAATAAGVVVVVAVAVV